MDAISMKGQTSWIDLNLIDIPDHFREHAQEALEGLVKDIQQHGQLQEIVVTPKDGGRYELVAGKGRTMAIQKLGWQQIRAQVLTGASELDKVMISIAENEEREDVSPIDKALSYKRAMDVGQIDQRELAKRRGMTEAAISQYMALASLPEETRKNLSRLKLGAAHMTEILRLPKPEDQMKLAEEASKDELSSKEVRAQVKKLLSKPETEKAVKEKPKEEPGFHFTWKGEDLTVQGRWAAAGKGPATLSMELQTALTEFIAEHPVKVVPAETHAVAAPDPVISGTGTATAGTQAVAA